MSSSKDLVEEALNILSSEALVSKTPGRGDFPSQVPGRPAVSGKGNEIPGSMALGEHSIVYQDGRETVIESQNVVDEITFRVVLFPEEVRMLKSFL